MRFAIPFGFWSSAVEAAVTAANKPGSLGLLGLCESGLLSEENRLLLLPLLLVSAGSPEAFIRTCSVVPPNRSAVAPSLPAFATIENVNFMLILKLNSFKE